MVTKICTTCNLLLAALKHINSSNCIELQIRWNEITVQNSDVFFNLKFKMK